MVLWDQVFNHIFTYRQKREYSTGHFKIQRREKEIVKQHMEVLYCCIHICVQEGRRKGSFVWGVGSGITQPPMALYSLGRHVHLCSKAFLSFFSSSQARGSRLPDILRVTGASQLQRTNLKEACAHIKCKGVNLVAALVYWFHWSYYY